MHDLRRGKRDPRGSANTRLDLAWNVGVGDGVPGRIRTALHVGAGRADEAAADRELGGGEQMSVHGGDRPGASLCGRLTSARSSLHRAT
jgi:hypothetical protein